MVAQLISLKMLMAWNSLRRNTVGLVLGLLAFLGFLQIGALTYFALIALALAADVELLAMAIVLIATLILLGWMLIPVLFSGIDESLQPQALSTYLPPSRKLAVALVAATGAGPVGIASAIVSLAFPVSLFLAHSPGAAAIALVVTPILLLTAWTWARLITTSLSVFLARNSKYKDSMTLVGGFIFLALLAPLGVWIPLVTENFSVAWVSGILSWFTWLPFAAPLGTVWSFVHGHLIAAAAQFALSIVFLLLGFGLWMRVLPLAMTGTRHSLSPEEHSAVAQGRYLVDPTKAHVSSQVHSRSHSTYFKHVDFWCRLGFSNACASMAARTSRDWFKDPRLSMALASAVIFPFMAIMMSVIEVEGVSFTFGVMFLYFLPVILGTNSGALPSYDSTAFWILASSTISGRDERMGRMAGTLIWQIPLLIAGSAIPGFIIGYEIAEVITLTAFCVCLYVATFSLSLTLSAAWVYPVPPPGASPFSTRGTSNFMLTTLLQFGAIFGSFALALPASVVYIIAWGGLGLSLTVSTIVSLTWTLLVLAFAPGIAGRVWDKRNVAVLTQIRAWPGH